eukprot:Hpha_TRINITY_DN4501_c0_g1::TRINITY_DN4501_c0_g1_i1::g.115402::m.115402
MKSHPSPTIETGTATRKEMNTLRCHSSQAFFDSFRALLRLCTAARPAPAGVELDTRFFLCFAPCVTSLDALRGGAVEAATKAFVAGPEPGPDIGEAGARVHGARSS